jgi:hypothetical protein
MIGELTIYLWVMAIEPNGKEHLIEDRKESTYEECIYDQLSWGKKAQSVSRGDWELNIGCIFHHEEGTTVSLQELPPNAPPEVKELTSKSLSLDLPVRKEDSGSKQQKTVKKKKHKSNRS